MIAQPEGATPTRTTFVGVSTKAYLGYAATTAWLAGVRTAIDTRPALAAGRVQAFVAPSFPLIPAALDAFHGSPVWVGAQNASWGDGALTGEVSPGLLAEMGVRLVEIGHAERRAHFGETDEVVARKTRAALGAGLLPLLCVGEPARGNPAEVARVVANQLFAALGGSLADAHLATSLVLAYEPIWAIGASEPAEPGYVNAVLGGIRRVVGERAGLDPADIRIIYGGSAGPGLLSRLPEADGLFLGRFAHDPGAFAAVIDEALER